MFAEFCKRLLGRTQLPRLTVIVIIYDMAEQAEKTLHSLSAEYQLGVVATDYEVIAIENRSGHTMSPEFVKQLPGNIRYFLRDETVPTPLPAIDFAVKQARAPAISIAIDGARLASPGIIQQTLQALQMHPNAVVAVPGYHLGEKLQQESTKEGYDRTYEAQLLADIEWPNDGYRLFEISCLSGSCRNGFLLPLSESNFLSMPQHLYQAIGGIEQGFTTPGGGFANLDLYKRACEYPGSQLFMLGGEGTFHQHHGGVTTGGKQNAEREALMEAQRRQYETMRGSPYNAPRVEPVLLGPMKPAAHRFMEHSLRRAMQSRGIDV